MYTNTIACAALHTTKSQSQEVAAAAAELEQRSGSLRDTSGLVALKEAIKSLKAELTDVGVRTGVLQHTLLQVSLRPTRGALRGPSVVRASLLHQAAA